jgi:1,4-dihydroxy-2-naphthoyl-CoA synthase
MFSFDGGRNKLCCVVFREFLKSLALFSKPLVAGVHGAAVGLGVTMLPFFDMVFASDKATFYTPYAKLGQVPEGAAILTLPHMLGNAVVSTNARVSCRVYFFICCIKYIVFFLYSSCCKIIFSVGYTLCAIVYGSQALTHVEN